jgi:regulator of replication initiation timing
MVQDKLNNYEKQIKDLTQQIYDCYKRIKELTEENEKLKNEIDRLTDL